MDEQYLHGTEIVEIDNGACPTRTAQSGVIGLMVSFGISKVNDGSDLFRQCVANISYCGSYPNNKDNKTVELITS